MPGVSVVCGDVRIAISREAVSVRLCSRPVRQAEYTEKTETLSSAKAVTNSVPLMNRFRSDESWCIIQSTVQGVQE